MSVLENDHPLNDHVNALTDQFSKFQISGQMGYRFLVRPHVVRTELMVYFNSLDRLSPTSDDYKRSSSTDVVTVLMQPRSIAAMNDTFEVSAYPPDFVELLRRQHHFTKEQAKLLAALYRSALRSCEPTTTH